MSDFFPTVGSILKAFALPKAICQRNSRRNLCCKSDIASGRWAEEHIPVRGLSALAAAGMSACCALDPGVVNLLKQVPTTYQGADLD